MRVPTLRQGEVSRDGAFYETVVETIMNYCPPGASRACTQVFIQYYVNGPMIDGYRLDPENKIHENLKHADIWFKVIGYTDLINHTAYSGPALGWMAPNTINLWPLRSPPPHPQGFWVGGAFEGDPETRVMVGEPIIWDEPEKLDWVDAVLEKDESAVQRREWSPYCPMKHAPVRLATSPLAYTPENVHSDLCNT